MKKFLVIAFVLMLAFGAFAGDGKSMLDAMWFSNMIGISYADQSNPQAQTADASKMNVGTNNKGWYHLINFFQYGFSKNLYEGNGLKVDGSLYGNLQFRKGGNAAGAMEFITTDQFVTNLTFANVYTMGLGMKGVVKANIVTGGNFFAWDFTRISFIFNNAIAIAKIMNINLNAENVLVWESDNNYQTRDTLFLNASLSGSYDFGLSWSVGESITLGFDLYKSNGWSGSNEEAVFRYDRDHDDWRDVPYYQTSLSIGQDLLGPAGIKAVSLKLALDQVAIFAPQFQAGEANNLKLQTQGKYGLNLGVKEFSFGLFFILGTQDTINSQVGYNTKSNYWSGPRLNGRGQAGLQFNLGFTKDFFSFGFTYTGQAQIRDFDVFENGFTSMPTGDMRAAGQAIEGPLFSTFGNGNYRWLNQFDVSFTFNW